MRGRRTWVAGSAFLALLAAAGVLALATVVDGSGAAAEQRAVTSRAFRGIHKIRHVVIIMQENRSFDSTSARTRERMGFLD